MKYKYLRMEGLDDLLDDLSDSPKKKITTTMGGKKDDKKKKKSIDEFEGMLDEMLGSEEKPKGMKKPSNSFQPIAKKDADFEFQDSEEEKKEDHGGSWGGGTGETASYKPAAKATSLKKPKKGDKWYPVVLAGEDVLSGYWANSMNLAVWDKMMWLECAHNVVRIFGKKWDNDVDYRIQSCLVPCKFGRILIFENFV